MCGCWDLKGVVLLFRPATWVITIIAIAIIVTVAIIIITLFFFLRLSRDCWVALLLWLQVLWWLEFVP